MGEGVRGIGRGTCGDGVRKEGGARALIREHACVCTQAGQGVGHAPSCAHLARRPRLLVDGLGCVPVARALEQVAQLLARGQLALLWVGGWMGDWVGGCMWGGKGIRGACARVWHAARARGRGSRLLPPPPTHTTTTTTNPSHPTHRHPRTRPPPPPLTFHQLSSSGFLPCASTSRPSSTLS